MSVRDHLYDLEKILFLLERQTCSKTIVSEIIYTALCLRSYGKHMEMKIILQVY